VSRGTSHRRQIVRRSKMKFDQFRRLRKRERAHKRFLSHEERIPVFVVGPHLLKRHVFHAKPRRTHLIARLNISLKLGRVKHVYEPWLWIVVENKSQYTASG